MFYDINHPLPNRKKEKITDFKSATQEKGIIAFSEIQREKRIKDAKKRVYKAATNLNW